MILKSTILVYMILNCKGSLTGCGLHGYSLVSILFYRSIQYSCLFLYKNFLLLLACFVLLLLYIIVQQWRRTPSSVS